MLFPEPSMPSTTTRAPGYERFAVASLAGASSKADEMSGVLVTI